MKRTNFNNLLTLSVLFNKAKYEMKCISLDCANTSTEIVTDSLSESKYNIICQMVPADSKQTKNCCIYMNWSDYSFILCRYIK